MFAHAFEPVFGGLDRAVRFHRTVGPSAIVLLVVHVICLALDALSNGASIGNIFIPFWSQSARSIDILTFYLLLLLGALAYDRRMSYERWLFVHRFLGPLFLAGTAHAAMEPGTIADFEPLRTWIVILILAGGAAWLYRVLLFDRLGPRYYYRLETIASRGSNILDLVMRPVERRMMYEPGTFVLLRASRGRITAAAIASDIAPLDNYAVMLCGQLNFVADLARQFRALGIPPDRIITEEFEFR